MEIVFHAHHAVVSDSMRRRAEAAIRKVSRRVPRAHNAVIRFDKDGPARRVELVLQAPKGRRFLARAEARFFGTALAEAARRLAMQIDHTKRTPKSRARRVARTEAA